MTTRMCKCSVRELRGDEELCPACTEEDTAFWRKLVGGAVTVALPFALFILTGKFSKPES